MKTRILFGIILTFTSIYSSLSAQQEQWSLSKCIDHALEHNLQIQQQQLSTEINNNYKNQAMMNFAPNINGGATHTYNIGQKIDPYTNTFASDKVRSNNFYASSSITLYNGLRQVNNYQKSQLDYEASKLDLEQTKQDIILAITNAYLQVLFAMELENNAQNQVNITQQQVDRTKKLVEIGSLAKGSLLEMEAQLANEELALVNARNSHQMAKLNLAQLLVIDNVDEFSIVKPNLDIPSNYLLDDSVNAVINYALHNQNSVKSAELKVESAEKSLAISKGALAPTLTFSGSYGTGYSGAARQPIGDIDTLFVPFGITESLETVYVPNYSAEYAIIPFADQINNNLNKSFGFNLTIPIYNNGSAYYGIKNASANVEIAKLNQQQTINTVTQNIQQAYYDAHAAYQKYLASEKSFKALQESFKYTNEKFNVGMVNALDFNDAKNKLAKAESDLLQAKFEYIFSLKILDFYKGIELKL